MAVRQSASHNGGTTRRAWFVVACLVVLFVAALFLRAYWNLDAANPSEGEFILSGGSDPYYHKRAADQIQDNGFRHHLNDPLLNYPRGSENPNPPFYQWFIATGGQMMAGLLGGVDESTWQVAIWSPAIFGSLTVFPIYFIGAALFDRRAGLIAALIWTVSTSAIDAGGVGLADHDATVLFFASLAFLFYVQTIRHFRGDGNWVAKWGDGGAVSTGLRNLFRQRRAGFAYALLTAVAIAAVALTWKGFNYVLGILFIYAIVQMVADHWRNRDSAGLFLGTLLAMALSVVIAYPYYAQAGVANFLQPTWYILGAFVVAGLVLVPTRDLPTLLVLPIAGIVAALLGVLAFFVFPTVAQSLLYATVYFKQTRLYETIAEAHPADFSTIMFGVGPLAFFLALAGWVVLLFKLHHTGVAAWTRIGLGAGSIALGGIIMILLGLANSEVADAIGLMVFGFAALAGLSIVLGGEHPSARLWGFALLWGAVAVFMAQSAVRFLINAIPVFAVLAGYMAVWVIDWLDFGSIRKSLAANRGNAWQGIRRGTRPLHVVAVILIALLFVFPTTILAADAALPPEAEDKLAREADSDFARRFYTERMGAYGGGFGSVKPWIAPLQWLDQHDANITDHSQRPAFLSWWDYGHWAIAIGNHPTVADNFQNGYEFAANFILSQSEAHAIQLLAARTAEAPGADLEAALRDAGSADAAADAASIRSWESVNLTVDQSAALLAAVEQQTGKKIRYFAVDIRMLPYDNPQTSSVDQSSIFYAPVRLKGDNPDDYVTTQVNVGQAVPGAPDGHVTVDRYKELASNPIVQTTAVGERFLYQDAFFDSMYWRSYVGTEVTPQEGQPILGTEVEAALGNPRPAGGLEHFRLVYAGEIQRVYKGGDPADARSYLYYPGVMIIEYTPGAYIEGTVTEEGQPVAGATVTAYDDAGTILKAAFQNEEIEAADFHVPHAQATTGADGSFRILAPFAMEGGGVTLDASRGGVSIATTQVAVTREQAEARETIGGVTLTVARGVVEGVAFLDEDGNGVYNETNESVVGNATLTIGGVTVVTDGDGTYRADDVSAGLQNVTSETPELQVGLSTSRVRVQPAANVTHNVALEPRTARYSGQLIADLDGDGNATGEESVDFQTLTFTADAGVADNTARDVTAFTEQGGNFSIQLRPGTYAITATYTHTDNSTYSLSDTLTIGPGEAREGETLVMTRDE